MYTELYHFLPHTGLPSSQMCSTHLLVTMISLLSADQRLILLNHQACSESVSHTRMLAAADYYNCLYFWNMLSRPPCLIRTTLLHGCGKPRAAQPSRSGEAGRRDCAEGTDPPSVLPECRHRERVAGKTGQTAWTSWACFPPHAAAHHCAGSWHGSAPTVCAGSCTA